MKALLSRLFLYLLTLSFFLIVCEFTDALVFDNQVIAVTKSAPPVKRRIKNKPTTLQKNSIKHSGVRGAQTRTIVRPSNRSVISRKKSINSQGKSKYQLGKKNSLTPIFGAKSRPKNGGVAGQKKPINSQGKSKYQLGKKNSLTLIFNAKTKTSKNSSITTSKKNSAAIWSATKNKTAVKNAFSHYKKHRKAFPEFKNAKQYVQGTKKFINNPPKGTLVKKRTNGDTLLYHPKTNTFGVKTSVGVPKTMFRPKGGINYWNKQ